MTHLATIGRSDSWRASCNHRSDSWITAGVAGAAGVAGVEGRIESKTGNKAWLRCRLHGAIVRDHLDAAVYTALSLKPYHLTF